MWPIILAAICFALYHAPAPRAALRDVQQYFFPRISAPSSSTPFVPSTVPAGPVLTSTVPIVETSCPVSDFTSTLWFCPSATATATATTATITTSTSTPLFSPSDIPEPLTVETHAPSVTGILCVGLVAFFAVLLICSKRRKVQLKGMQLPVAPPEEVATMTCWESIVTGAFYDCSADRETLNNIAILQWHDNESLRSQITANKRSSDDRESAHQKKIDEIESEHKDEVSRLHKEITARELDHGKKIGSINADRDAVEKGLREQIAAIESAHRDEISRRQRSYQLGIDKIKSNHKKDIAKAHEDANNQRRRLGEEVRMREEAEAKLAAFIKASMLVSGLPKPTAQTSPQDGAPTSTGDQLLTPPAAAVSSITQNAAPDSTTDQLLLAHTATEDSTKEAEKALPEAPASPVTTSEPDSAEPTAETSTQDVAPGTEGQLPIPPAATSSPVVEPEEPLSAEHASPTTTPELDSAAKTSTQDVEPETEDQLPSPPAATESSMTEPEEALPASIPSPITEAEDKSPAETEGLSEAESTNSTEHEQEQEKEQKENEKVEEEPQNSGMPLHEPSSMGEGAEQIPQDQEKGLAQDAPVPTEEPAATSQLTEPKAAPGPATSDDGASEAPVTKKVLPEEQTGDRETKEPTAVEESDEILGAIASNNGAIMAPATKESDPPLPPWHFMTRTHDTPYVRRHGSATVDDLVDSMEISGRKKAEEQSGANAFEVSEMVAHLISPQPSSAIAVDSGEGMETEESEETPSSEKMVVDDEGPANDSSAEQSNSVPDETPPPDDMDTSDNGGTANDSSAGQSNSVPDETPPPDDMDTSENNATANDHGTEQSDSADGMQLDSLGDGENGGNTANDSENGSSDPAGEDWLGSGMVHDGDDVATSGIGSQSNGTTTEMAQFSQQTHGNGQVLPYQSNTMHAAETAQYSHQASGNGQMLSYQSSNMPVAETSQYSHQAYGNGQVPSYQSTNMPAAEAPQSSHQAYGNNQGLQFQSTNMQSMEMTQPENNPSGNLSGAMDIEEEPPQSSGGFNGATKSTMASNVRPATEPARDVSEEEDAWSQFEQAKKADTPIETPTRQPSKEQAAWNKAKTLEEPSKSSEDDPVERDYRRTGWRPDETADLPPDEPDSDLDDDDEMSKEILKKMMEDDDADEDPSAESDETPEEDSKPAPPPARVIKMPRTKRTIAQMAQSHLPAQGVQSTQQTPSQPTPQPSTQNNPPPARPAKDRALEKATEMNSWVVQANKVSYQWMPSEGSDATTFINMKRDPASQFSKIIDDAQLAADYLKNDLKKSPLSAGAELMFRHVVPGVKKMRVQYAKLRDRKGCPQMFVFLMSHIDGMLNELKDLVPEEFTPAKDQPLRVNPLFAPQMNVKPSNAAKQIFDWIYDAKEKCYSWQPDLEEGGTDADSFAKMQVDYLSPLWQIDIRMCDAAEYLEHERQTLRQAVQLYCMRVLPLAESMREQYEQLGALKDCPKVFENLLSHVDRVLVQLNELEQESSAAVAQSAQSTPQVPPPPPSVTQAANPLLFANSATQAANLMKKWLTDAGKMHGEWASSQYNAKYFVAERKNTDSAFSMVVKQMSWAAHYLENGHYKPDIKPNRVLRDCLQLAVTVLFHYQQLYNAKSDSNLLYWLKEDIDRVLEALRKIKP